MPRFREPQSGLTLMEMLVAITISLVVALGMVTMMANTLGTGSRTIEMARLTAELRSALQIMSREVRRANYHGNFTKCFANIDCRSTLDDGDVDASGYIKAVTINAGGDCFYFWFDRDSDGDVTNDDDVGAFRRGVRNGVGTIEMTTTLNTTPDCDSNNNWTLLTDPNIVNVTGFVVNNGQSYTDVITGNATQRIDKIRMRITGQLVTTGQATSPECFNAANTNICVRTVEDVIRVRNDIYTPAP